MDDRHPASEVFEPDLLDGDDDLPPPPDDEPPRRRPGPGAPALPLPFPVIFFAIAVVVGVERVSMLMFVTDAGPTVLIVSGMLFLSMVGLVTAVGVWAFTRYR